MHPKESKGEKRIRRVLDFLLISILVVYLVRVFEAGLGGVFVAMDLKALK